MRLLAYNGLAMRETVLLKTLGFRQAVTSRLNHAAGPSMTEFVIRLADDRGRVLEQTHAAATAEELRSRFTQAGFYVYSVKARNALGGGSRKKV